MVIVTKRLKKCAIKRILEFNDFKKCLLDKKIILKSQQNFESETPNVYTEIIRLN